MLYLIDFFILVKSASSVEQVDSPGGQHLTPEQLRSAIEDLLEELDLDRSAVRLGNTQVRSITLCFDMLQLQFSNTITVE